MQIGDEYSYQWARSPEEEQELTRRGYRHECDSGRYPSRMFVKKLHCGACSQETQGVLDDLGRYVDLCGCK